MTDIVLLNSRDERVVSGSIAEKTISTADRIKWKGVIYNLHTVDDETLTFKEIAADVDVTDLLVCDDTLTVELVGADGSVHAKMDLPRGGVSARTVRHSGRIYTLRTTEMNRLIYRELYRELEPDLDLTPTTILIRRPS